jgi:Glycosyl transferase family 2
MSSRSDLTISVVVPFHNEARYIARCIESLLQQNYLPDRYEIIMVDNNSTDNSAEQVAAHARVKLLAEARPGSYAARNRGVAHATGDVIAFTDGDCIASHDWLRTIASAMQHTDAKILLGGSGLRMTASGCEPSRNTNWTKPCMCSPETPPRFILATPTTWRCGGMSSTEQGPLSIWQGEATRCWFRRWFASTLASSCDTFLRCAYSIWRSQLSEAGTASSCCMGRVTRRIGNWLQSGVSGCAKGCGFSALPPRMRGSDRCGQRRPRDTCASALRALGLANAWLWHAADMELEGSHRRWACTSVFGFGGVGESVHRVLGFEREGRDLDIELIAVGARHLIRAVHAAGGRL